jgi:predicted MFS family arabinose efflux permease
MEAINGFASSYYFNYIFFYMQEQFQFSRMENLALCALTGLVYIPGSWFGGRFAQKKGYLTSLQVGFAIMSVMLVAGMCVKGLAAQIVVMALWVFGLCFIWPALEALISEGETRKTLPKMIGFYNVVWATTSAMAYFVGGAVMEYLGLKSIYWFTCLFMVLQLAMATYLKMYAPREAHEVFIKPEVQSESDIPKAENAMGACFLKMAWVANPFAYMAVNTVIAVIPDLALKLHLTPMLAGFFCSIFFFSRLVAFIGLWMWPGWHYQFKWLIGSYLSMIVSFILLLSVPNLAVIILSQVVFGLALGLIYYSSLFYSMDVGDTKGEHGGFHEALIGVGIFAGPAIGSSALYLHPSSSNSGTWAVCVALLVGLLVVLYLFATSRRTLSTARLQSKESET